MVSDIPTFADAIMPRSTIKNCARTVLKDDTNIQKDALTAITRGSTVFISYLTAYANEIALSKKRKTIMPTDVLEALKLIEFERFVPEMQALYESIENEAKEKRERRKAEATDLAETEVQVPKGDADEEDIEIPNAKKARTVNAQATKNGTLHNDGDSNILQDPQRVDANDSDDEVAEDEEVENEDEEEEGEEEEEGDEDDLANKKNGDPETIAEGNETIDDFENRQVDVYDEVLDNGEDSELEADDENSTS